MDQFSRSTGAVQTRFISCQLACHPTATPASSWRWSSGFRGLAGLVESQKHRPSPGRPGGLPGQQRSGRDREPKEPKHGVVVEVDGGAEGDRREMMRDAQADLRKRERPQCRDRGNGGGWQSRGFVMRGKACVTGCEVVRRGASCSTLKRCRMLIVSGASVELFSRRPWRRKKTKRGQCCRTAPQPRLPPSQGCAL